ncbi:MAG: hypothetical protein KBH06_02460 [Spirochaetes bacterium]|nr:hypothetical protein [Spirochaetota bacterium]
MSKKKWIIIISSLVVIITITITILFSTYLRANIILFRLSIKNSNTKYYQRIEAAPLESNQTRGSFYVKDQFKISIPTEYNKVGSSKIGQKINTYSFVSGEKKIVIMSYKLYDKHYEFQRDALKTIPDDISFFDSDEKIRTDIGNLVVKYLILSIEKNIELYESNKFDIIYDETDKRCHVEVYNKQHSKNVKFLFRNLKKEEILEIVKTISFE